MKKTLLLSTAILVSVAGYSQNTANTAGKSKLQQKTSFASKKAINDPKVYGPSNSKKITSYPKNSSGCSSALPFTQAVNCLATGGGITTDEQNCLTYNADLNTVFWTTRASTEWNWTGRTSGAIQVTFLNLNANKWDSTILYDDPTAVDGGRYPGGVSLNVAGDTSIAHAYMVGTGPAVGSAFEGEWYASRSLGGGETGLHSIPPADQNYAPFSSAGFFGNISSGFLNADIQQVGSTQAIVAGALNDPNVTATNAGTIKGAVLGKAVLTGTTVTWSADSTSLRPNFYKGVLGYGNNSEPARLAFSPDGTIGYAVFIGRVATPYNNNADSTYAPIVYKSTNAGATWNYLSNLEGYDWPCKHPECEQGVANYGVKAMTEGLYTPKSVNPRNYQFSIDQGMDLAVDVNGTLHLVCTLTPPGSYIDSLGFGYSLYYDYINHHPIIWDFMCDGTSWKTLAVDSVLSGACGVQSTDSTAVNAPFSADGSTTSFLGYTAHITVSRSTDGKVIFYGWSDSDRGNVSTFNNQPDVMIKGYNVVTGKLTATTDVTGGNGVSYYPYVSNLSYYDNAQQAYVVPVVYGIGTSKLGSTPTGTLYDGTKPMQFFYNNCGVFNAGSFTQSAIVHGDNIFASCVLGINSHNAFESAISNYPNPFNNTTTIAVTLSENKAVDVKIYNAIGNLVFSKNIKGNVGENTVTFDGGQLSSGVYYYTVTAGNQQATKKMIIQK